METSEIKYTKDFLLELLHNDEITVEFTKKDGTVRKMLCTLQQDKLPKVEIKEGEEKRKKTPNPDIISVWDLEKKAWRSFRVDSVKAFTFSI